MNIFVDVFHSVRSKNFTNKGVQQYFCFRIDTRILQTETCREIGLKAAIFYTRVNSYHCSGYMENVIKERAESCPTLNDLLSAMQQAVGLHGLESVPRI